VKSRLQRMQELLDVLIDIDKRPRNIVNLKLRHKYELELFELNIQAKKPNKYEKRLQRTL